MFHFKNPTNQVSIYCNTLQQVTEKIVEISKPTFPAISMNNVYTFCDNSGKDHWQYIVGDLTFDVSAFNEKNITMSNPGSDYEIVPQE